LASPFPGMDPYLEAQGMWGSFHAALVAHCAEALNQVLPESYVAQIKTSVPARRSPREVELRDRWFEILSVSEMELVTVVEILCPGNKVRSGRNDYPGKRAERIDRPINFVEFDLLLGGRRMPMAEPVDPGDYYAVVGRNSGTPEAQVYAWSIRHTLPAIPIPLRAPDTDVTLDLRQAFDLTYDRGRYSFLLRYGKPLPDTLPLAAADREWAESVGR
jgi:Protein of unknown function (DUF4058)